MRTDVALALATALLCGSVDAQLSREVRKTLPLRSDGRVMIDTYKGSIQVDPWDKAEIEVIATITADGTGRDDEDAVEATRIEISGSETSVRITTDYDRVRRRPSRLFGLITSESAVLPLVDYTIRMPAQAGLRIKDYKSDTRINGLAADLRINTYKGTVEIRDLSGSIDLETYKGEAEIELRQLRRSSAIETYKGDITLRISGGMAFDLVAEIGRKGRLDSHFPLADRGRVDRRDRQTVRTAVEGGGPELRLKTYKGDFRLVKN